MGKPFEFVDDQNSNHNEPPVDSKRFQNLERELYAYTRHIQELEDLVKMTEN